MARTHVEEQRRPRSVAELGDVDAGSGEAIALVVVAKRRSNLLETGRRTASEQRIEPGVHAFGAPVVVTAEAAFGHDGEPAWDRLAMHRRAVEPGHEGVAGQVGVEEVERVE